MKSKSLTIGAICLVTTSLAVGLGLGCSKRKTALFTFDKFIRSPSDACFAISKLDTNEQTIVVLALETAFQTNAFWFGAVSALSIDGTNDLQKDFPIALFWEALRGERFGVYRTALLRGKGESGCVDIYSRRFALVVMCFSAQDEKPTEEEKEYFLEYLAQTMPYLDHVECEAILKTSISIASEVRKEVLRIPYSFLIEKRNSKSRQHELANRAETFFDMAYKYADKGKEALKNQRGHP